MLLFFQSHEAHGSLSLLLMGVLISLFRISFIENFCLCIHKFTLVGKTWIYQSCQHILLSFLLYISLNTLPLSSSHFTLTSIWLITFSHCPFCMSPITNLLLYLFFPFFLSVLLLVAVTNFRYLFFSFSDATRGSAVKRFSISFARHPTNGTFCFYFKRYSPASSFFIFILFQYLGYTISFISPSLISIGI